MKATSNWLEMWARFKPDAEALLDIGTGRRWTWALLHRDSLVWAERLRREGVAPGDRVAVLAHNRGETIALLFACAELGAILFPMNWRLAPAELAWQFADCTPKVLVCDRENAPQAGRIIDLDTPMLTLSMPPADFIAVVHISHIGQQHRSSVVFLDCDVPYVRQALNQAHPADKVFLGAHHQELPANVPVVGVDGFN